MTTIHLVKPEHDDLFQNPILETGADPWIFEYDGLYYYCFSDNKSSIFVSVAKSPLELEQADKVLVWKAKSGKAYSHQTWAPEIYRLDGKWYIYFAASNGRNSSHRNYVLEADKAEGPYRFKGQISPETDRWAIDGTIIEHDDGERYFVWSGWDGRANTQQNLYISRMKNPWTLVSGKKSLLKSRKLKKKAKNTDPQTILELEVEALQAAEYLLEVSYCCEGSSMHRLTINDETHAGLHYQSTGFGNWQTHYEYISLRKGRNLLSFARGIGSVEVKEIKVKGKGTDRIAISSPEYSWERLGGPPFVNEGPSAIKKNGKLHLVYSASGSWTDDYQMGLLSFLGGDILDKRNWKKKAIPIFCKTADVFGPGHASFIHFRDQEWIVYHSAKHSGAGWNREVRMQPFSWTADDEPFLGQPRRADEAISTHCDDVNGKIERWNGA